SVAIEPNSRMAWISRLDRRLEWINCHDFRTVRTYKLPRECYRIAVDGRGMVYAVAQRELSKQRPRSQAEAGIADLMVFDTRSIGPTLGEIEPSKTITVGGIIRHMCLSPDDNWLYYLDAHNRKVGKLNLKDASDAGSTDQIVAG